MGKQTSVLDGPRMGYGPGQQQDAAAGCRCRR